MSLTSLLKRDSVKQLFTDTFGSYDKPLVAVSYSPPLTRNFALVGTAFDYLLRFHLAKSNNVTNDNWVAEHALYSPHYKQAETAIRNAKESFIANNQADWPIHCLRLAMLDRWARARTLELSPIKKKDIDDLRNLIKLVPFEKLSNSYCILNPTFGYGSHLVGGADADFIIGNLLVDIKTTKYLKFTDDMYHQLIGYQLLANYYGVDGYNLKIKKVGIYFARHGLLVTTNVKIPRRFFKEFKKLI